MLMCAVDFCRALNERSWFYKWLFRLAVGKYAYREYELLFENLKRESHMPDRSYELEEMSYHKKSMAEIIKEWDES